MRDSSRASSPILKLIVPLIIAILMADVVATPLWLSLTVVAIAALWFTVRSSSLSLYLVIFSFATIIASPSATASLEPLSVASEFALQPLNSYSARVVAYRTADDEWHEIDAKVNISPGDVSLSNDSLAICSARFSASRLYLTTHNHSAALSDMGIRAPLSARLYGWASERLAKLGLRGDAHASAVAMSLGERRYLDEQIVEDYRRSGTAHLLALSGMHIGIIFMILRVLFYFVPLVRYGNILADVLTIIFIWLFAGVAGFGDSVVRAAAMFTILQLSQIASRRYDSLTSLVVAATLMLLFDVGALHDLGFQLSFVAVAAIIIWAVPITYALRSSSALLNLVVSSVVMGVVATIATAPLIAYAFGYISLLSPVITLPLLLTLSVIIIGSVVWILIPFSLLAPLFREVVSCAATIQNYIAGWVANLEWGYYECRLSHIEVVAIYIVYLIVAVATIHFIAKRKSKFSPSKALQEGLN